MRLKLLFFFITLSITAHGQIQLNPNPADINSGTITITYGAQGDYSLFDPMGDPNLLLYTGLETDGVPSTWDYHDDFSDASTFVVFNYDATAGAYVAQIDIANRIYQEEPNLNLTTIPTGTQVNDWYFLIITTDLSRQSPDLKGSDYGWQPSTLSEQSPNMAQFDVRVVEDTFYFSRPDTYRLSTYDLTGKLIADEKVLVGTTYELKTDLVSGIYVTRIEDSNGFIRTLKHVR